MAYVPISLSCCVAYKVSYEVDNSLTRRKDELSLEVHKTLRIRRKSFVGSANLYNSAHEPEGVFDHGHEGSLASTRPE